MRSTLFSAIVIASTVSFALGAPAAASVSVSAGTSASASVAANARPSVFPDPLSKNHMKMKIPSNLLSEHKQIVPMMVMEDVRDKTVQKNQQIKGYKKFDLTNNGQTSLDVIKVTPLLPSMQHDASIINRIDTSEQDAVGNERRYKKFLGVSDNGDKQDISIPYYEKTNTVIVEEEQVYPLGVEGKTRVVVDKHGNMRYLDIPYYNRAASFVARNEE